MFWEQEHIGILSSKQHFSPDEQVAWRKVSESGMFDGKWYQVAVPWKEERPRLVSNRLLAERRLQQAKRKLAKDEKMAMLTSKLLTNTYKRTTFDTFHLLRKGLKLNGCYLTFRLFTQTELQRRSGWCLMPQPCTKGEVLTRRLYQVPSYKITFLIYW